MPRFVLIGLCEPPDADSQAPFEEWFVDQHIEDTAKCPNFIRGSVFKLSGPHLDGETVSEYLSLYEVEAPSYEEAERVLKRLAAQPGRLGRSQEASRDRRTAGRDSAAGQGLRVVRAHQVIRWAESLSDGSHETPGSKTPAHWQRTTIWLAYAASEGNGQFQ